MKVLTHNNLDAWKKAMDLVKDIYQLMNTLFDSEKYGLTTQIKMKLHPSHYGFFVSHHL